MAKTIYRQSHTPVELVSVGDTSHYTDIPEYIFITPNSQPNE
jgi:hypothetical protein